MKRTMILLALSAACAMAGCASDGTFNTASNGDLNNPDLQSSAQVRGQPNPNDWNNRPSSDTARINADANLTRSDYNNSTASGSDYYVPRNDSSSPSMNNQTAANNQPLSNNQNNTSPNNGDINNGQGAPTSQLPNGNDKTALSAMVAQRDRDFITDVAASGIYEVQAGQKAVAKASDPKVKDLGQHMIDDHSKVNKQLMALAQQKGLHVSNSATDADHVALLGKLDGLNGSEFDREYLQQQAAEHQKAIDKFQTAANSGADRDVRDFAAATLPSLREHLAMINTGLGVNNNNTNIGSEHP